MIRIQKYALKDVSVDIDKGQFISIIGPSGAGKSTFLRTINKMIEVSSGEIEFLGEDITEFKGKELRKVRTKIGMIFQHYNLVERLSVLENVLHGKLGTKSTFAGMIGIYSQEEKKHAVDILKTLGLGDEIHKRAKDLSGGQKQRVGIARALIQKPELILCDEPIASLDPTSAKVTMDYLRTIVDEYGITCIVNLHQVDYAKEYSDRIIGINAGEVVFDGVPSKLKVENEKRIYRTN